MRTSIMLLLCVFLSSCAVNVVRYNTIKYEPRGEDYQIDVYQTQAPSRRYVEIARIDSNSEGIEPVIRKARELGADAVIIIGKAGTGSYVVPGYGVMTGGSYSYGISAVAIRYK